MTLRSSIALLASIILSACSPPAQAVDAGAPGGGEGGGGGATGGGSGADSGLDAGIDDAGTDDAGLDDAGLDDAGLDDAGLDDAGLDDAGLDDAGLDDAGIDDAGIDAGIDAGCPSGLLCGAGACCLAGSECLDGLCQPSCASGVRCGADAGLCCTAAQLCVNDLCAVPTTAPCIDSVDCAPSQRCEPSLGLCVPGPGTLGCELRPAAGFTPVLEWAWTSSSVHPTSVQVASMPVVVDLENDGLTDVVIITFETPAAGYLRALNGVDGTEKWAATVDALQSAYQVNPRGTAAAADLDGDGQVEIIAHRATGGLIAFNSNGSFRWSSTYPGGGAWSVTLYSPAVSVADFDADGSPELVVGAAVFDRHGRLLFDYGANAGSNGSLGPISIVADLDEMGPVLVTGRRAWRFDGNLLWDNGLSDGYSAVANLDTSTSPEVVVVSNGYLRVHSGSTGLVLGQVTLGASAGGPPVIADFDGDGVPDIGVSAGNVLLVYGWVGGALTPHWSAAIQDLGSHRTAASAFDFNGDGRPELAFNDECAIRLYDGATGSVLFQAQNSALTYQEYPVIADVDGDGRAELILPTSANVACATPSQGGLYVYGDPGWPRARRIWNQHNYNGTNISGDARVPATARRNWANWREGGAGGGAFDEPDLQVSLAANQLTCPASLRLEARVHNRGSRAAPAGVQVRFFLGATLLGTLPTPAALLPGHSVILTTDALSVSGAFRVVVDEANAVAECAELNNEASVTGFCP